LYLIQQVFAGGVFREAASGSSIAGMNFQERALDSYCIAAISSAA
jgi:hypothetical protein